MSATDHLLPSERMTLQVHTDIGALCQALIDHIDEDRANFDYLCDAMEVERRSRADTEAQAAVRARAAERSRAELVEEIRESMAESHTAALKSRRFADPALDLPRMDGSSATPVIDDGFAAADRQNFLATHGERYSQIHWHAMLANDPRAIVEHEREQQARRPARQREG